jgi:hypothetical protein
MTGNSNLKMDFMVKVKAPAGTAAGDRDAIVNAGGADLMGGITDLNKKANTMKTLMQGIPEMAG